MLEKKFFFFQKSGPGLSNTHYFIEYVSSLFRKAGTKLSVLLRLSYLMNFQQRRILMELLLEAQCGCLMVEN